MRRVAVLVATGLLLLSGSTTLAVAASTSWRATFKVGSATAAVTLTKLHKGHRATLSIKFDHVKPLTKVSVTVKTGMCTAPGVTIVPKLTFIRQTGVQHFALSSAVLASIERYNKAMQAHINDGVVAVDDLLSVFVTADGKRGCGDLAPASLPTFEQLHTFGLSLAEQAIVGFNAATAGGTPFPDVASLSLPPVLVPVYTANFFQGAWAQTYVLNGLTTTDPDLFPDGKTALGFFRVGRFRTPANAQQVAAASVAHLKDDLGYTAFKIVFLIDREAYREALQKVSGPLVTTNITLADGNFVWQESGTCRNCPIGTIPEDLKTLLDAQLLRMAVQVGLP